MKNNVYSQLATLVALLTLHCAATAAEPESSRLAVRGEASVLVAADHASFSIGVHNSAAQAQSAADDNARLMKQVKRALLKAGLEEKELASQFFNIQPQWQPRPRNHSGDWKPVIKGYQARSQLKVETAQLDRVAVLIQQGLEAGANYVSQLQFGLKDDLAARQQALNQATEQASAMAQAAAKAAGVELDAILELRVDNAGARPMAGASMAGMARMEQQLTPTIVPAQVRIDAQVELIYRINN